MFIEINIAFHLQEEISKTRNRKHKSNIENISETWENHCYNFNIRQNRLQSETLISYNKNNRKYSNRHYLKELQQLQYISTYQCVSNSDSISQE